MNKVQTKEFYFFIHAVVLIMENKEKIFLKAGEKIFRKGHRGKQGRPFIYKNKIISHIDFLKIKKNGTTI